jgi:hypothetical protein
MKPETNDDWACEIPARCVEHVNQPSCPLPTAHTPRSERVNLPLTTHTPPTGLPSTSPPANTRAIKHASIDQLFQCPHSLHVRRCAAGGISVSIEHSVAQPFVRVVNPPPPPFGKHQPNKTSSQTDRTSTMQFFLCPSLEFSRETLRQQPRKSRVAAFSGAKAPAASESPLAKFLIGGSVAWTYELCLGVR